ncbi:hypothetical protein VCHA53O466_50295 [Vibrio chagasii]|nr:hypothetical protein VCHA53O466_50295 [Vibrio chagasii]
MPDALGANPLPKTVAIRCVGFLKLIVLDMKSPK